MIHTKCGILKLDCSYVAMIVLSIYFLKEGFTGIFLGL